MRGDVLEELVKQDLSVLAKNVPIDEEGARNHFFVERFKQARETRKDKEKAFKASQSRLYELDRFILSVYEELRGGKSHTRRFVYKSYTGGRINASE